MNHNATCARTPYRLHRISVLEKIAESSAEAMKLRRQGLQLDISLQRLSSCPTLEAFKRNQWIIQSHFWKWIEIARIVFE